MDSAYPHAVLIPEGEEPRTGGAFAFDADFALVIHEAHASLFDNHGAGILPWHTPRAVLRRGRRGIHGHLPAYVERPSRRRSRPSDRHGHGRPRLQPAPLWRTKPEQLGAAFTLLFTWGVVPSLYYGDEIGMRYLSGMPNVEGAICNPAYNRAGCRTRCSGTTVRTPASRPPTPPTSISRSIPTRPGRPWRAKTAYRLHLTLVRDLLALRRATPPFRDMRRLALSTRVSVRLDPRRDAPRRRQPSGRTRPARRTRGARGQPRVGHRLRADAVGVALDGFTAFWRQRSRMSTTPQATAPLGVVEEVGDGSSPTSSPMAPGGSTTPPSSSAGAVSPRSTPARREARTRGFLDAIRSRTTAPVRTLVNTHHHGDHTHGNCLFDTATIVAHERTREAVLAENTPPNSRLIATGTWGSPSTGAGSRWPRPSSPSPTR